MWIWVLRKYVSSLNIWAMATFSVFLLTGILDFYPQIFVVPFIASALLWLGTMPLKPDLTGSDTDISYGVYIWHFPIMQIIVGNVHGLESWSLLVLTLLVTVPLAWLSWTYLEKPALRLPYSRINHGYRVLHLVKYIFNFLIHLPAKIYRSRSAQHKSCENLKLGHHETESPLR